MFDKVPLIDRDAWRLRLTGRVAQPTALSFADLEALPTHSTTAILDCTSGWWTEQVWSGHRLERRAARGRASAPMRLQATVVSVTGHTCAFPIGDLDQALLVTHVGDEPLSPVHGYPVRLAVPGRRGYQWVKWLDRIEVA